MGVTIHYRGRLGQPNRVEELTGELADVAKILGWETMKWTEDWAKPNSARLEPKKDGGEIRGHLPLRGITLFPHKHCEPLFLTFDPQGYLIDPLGMTIIAEGRCQPEEIWCSTKTQFAPIEIHVVLVKLLRHLRQRYMRDMVVEDEGGYWLSDDIVELKRRFDVVTRGMDQLQDGLFVHAKEIQLAKTTDQLIRIIESIFQQSSGGTHG